MTDTGTTPTVHSLQRPGGAVAYEVSGAGPLVVCAPGMGDLRSTYRFLAPALVAAGYRVAVTDLRGHGDSDATFSSYGDEATAGDLAALVETLGGPAVIVGNSMAAGAAVLVAAEHPELVAGLVLVGPFVRQPAIGRATRLLMRVAMNPLWVATTWKLYLPSLYAGAKPADFTDHRDQVVASLRRPGHAKAFSLTTRLTHDAAGAAVGSVDTPTLVVMGEKDPDFPDPKAEAGWIGTALKAEVVMLADSGHYPQSQQPDATSAAVLDFLARTTPRG